MPLPYLHYDVFTGEPLVGNQLAVFPDGRGVDAALMQRIAREMSFSESTFVLPAGAPGTDARLRIFTPAQELPMAGHPTIGSTFALAHAGVIAVGAPRFVFGLGVGPTPVDLEWDGGRLRFAWMTQPLPTFGAAVGDRARVASILGLTLADIREDLPVQPVSCGVPFLFVPVRDAAAVDRAVSDAAAFGRLRAETGADLPVFLFAPAPPATSATVYSRMFAPSFGIAEDPATGGASGPLGCYLVRYRLVEGDAVRRIVSLQGVAMGRASRVHVAIEGTPDVIHSVKVGGQAVLVGRGELLIDT